MKALKEKRKDSEPHVSNAARIVGVEFAPSRIVR